MQAVLEQTAFICRQSMLPTRVPSLSGQSARAHGFTVPGGQVGLFFVLAVWFLYKKAYQLQQVNHSEQTDQLVGRECTIYFKQSDSKYTVQTTRDGAMREVDVISESGKTYQTGDRTIITSYKDGTLFIQ